MTIQLEPDGRIAMDIFNLTTALNRAIAAANSAGLRVDINVSTLQQCGVPYGYPVTSARVYRLLEPLTEEDPSARQDPDTGEPPHAT